MNTEGVPVLLKVATIFCAMIALLPMPLTINRPFDLLIIFTTCVKESLSKFLSSLTDSLSMVSVRFASLRMSEEVLATKFLIKFFENIMLCIMTNLFILAEN